MAIVLFTCPWRVSLQNQGDIQAKTKIMVSDVGILCQIPKFKDPWFEIFHSPRGITYIDAFVSWVLLESTKKSSSIFLEWGVPRESKFQGASYLLNRIRCVVWIYSANISNFSFSGPYCSCFGMVKSFKAIAIVLFDNATIFCWEWDSVWQCE